MFLNVNDFRNVCFIEYDCNDIKKGLLTISKSILK